MTGRNVRLSDLLISSCLLSRAHNYLCVGFMSLRDYAVHVFVCSLVRSSVCLSSVTFVKSLDYTWQHVAANGTFRMDYDALV